MSLSSTLSDTYSILTRTRDTHTFFSYSTLSLALVCCLIFLYTLFFLFFRCFYFLCASWLSLGRHDFPRLFILRLFFVYSVSFFHIYQLFFFFLVRVLLRFNLYLPFGCVFSRFFISVFLVWFLLQNKMILLRFSCVSVDEVGKFGHYCYAKIRRKVTPIALDQEKEKESDIERVSENVLFIESLILHALFLISYRSRLRITFRMNKMLNAVLDSRESTELKNCIRTDRSTNCSVFLRTQHFWHTHTTQNRSGINLREN